MGIRWVKTKLKAQLAALLRENQPSKMFRHVVRVTIYDTRGLPAHEVTLRIRSEPLDAI